MARECRTAGEAAARHARATRQRLGSYLRRITRHLTGSDQDRVKESPPGACTGRIPGSLTPGPSPAELERGARETSALVYSPTEVPSGTRAPHRLTCSPVELARADGNRTQSASGTRARRSGWAAGPARATAARGRSRSAAWPA